MSLLRDSLKPLYPLTLLFGVTPFIWSNPTLKPLFKLLVILLITLCHVTIITGDLWEWILMQVEIIEGDHHMGQLILFVVKMLYSVGNLLTVIISFIKRRDYQRTMEYLESCDGQMIELRIPLNNRREIRKNVTLLILANVIAIGYVSVASLVYRNLEQKHSVTVLFLRLFFKYILMELLSLYAIMVQGAILTRFQAVNQGLKRYFLNSKIVGNGHEVLQSLASIHDQLGLAYKMHSNCIAIQLLGYFCPYIINIIYVLCLVYNIITGKDTVSMLSTLEIVWVSYSTTLHVLLVKRATETTSEALESGRLAHEIINQNRHSNLNELLALFSRQISHLDLRLSCGLFDFNWTFFMKVIGICTTYLVIMIQFGMF